MGREFRVDRLERMGFGEEIGRNGNPRSVGRSPSREASDEVVDRVGVVWNEIIKGIVLPGGFLGRGAAHPADHLSRIATNDSGFWRS